jgi:hypothetical protein
MTDDWQAAQFRDECERLRSVIEALETAEKSGTPHETVMLLASECGAAKFYKGASK